MIDRCEHSNKSNVVRLVSQVKSTIKIRDAQLSDEFFPAHVSIALIDAILTPRLNYHTIVVPIIERYCEYFNLQRFRHDRTTLPPVSQQETLTDLIYHYEALGSNGFQHEIIHSRYCSPGTRVLKSTNIKHAAIELRNIGVETLQDIQCKVANEVKQVLRPILGIGDRTIHMFLMYVGRDEFVKGDVHVIRFVQDALNKRRMSACEAEALVQGAAKRLGIAPRLLDYKIWEYGSKSN